MSAPALAGLRVVDLAGDVGNYCGKLFADLGADVVLVEPPGGCPQRTAEPTVASGPAAGTALAFVYQNTNKRSVVVDVDNDADLRLLHDMVAAADLVIDNWAPGELALRGLDRDAMTAVNPGLVVTSITPFGQTGPYARYQSADIVLLAMGGMLSLAGYGDGPPTRPYGDQSYVMAGLFGAVAAMMAVLHAEQTGVGQSVDVSVHECVTLALETAIQYYDLEGVIRGRQTGRYRHAGSGLYDCADGYVYLFVGGVASNRFWGRLVDWLVESGVPEAAVLHEPVWEDLDHLRTEEAKATFERLFTTMSAGRSKADLYHDAQAHGIPLSPVNSPADLVHSKQLRAREFFVQADDMYRAGYLTPGAPYQLSATPWTLRTSAPALGEHTEQVRAALREHVTGGAR
ncbi:MAG TPA: CoA transferase [Pseudonocardiaceae bacterium]